MGKIESPKPDKAMIKSTQERIAELLAKSDAVLSEVDEAFSRENAKKREYPVFDRSEFDLGPVLGCGGFCLVSEIESLHLPEAAKGNKKPGIDNLPGESPRRKTISFAQEDPTSEQDIILNLTGMLKPNEDNVHYDLDTARDRMIQLCRRDGDARYAIKRLHSDLNELERTRGMLDLALEVKYLSVLWHPNIVKMRAHASCPSTLNPDFFIIMDRLYDRLDDRISQWAYRFKKAQGNVLCGGRDKAEIDAILMERLVVAHDLARAFDYIHQLKIVYRDVKQENIGFDIRGDVKVFDFGLSKSLSPQLKERDGYRLTPRTGSVPYMAPEVVNCIPYDTSCDVFSFAILFWEIMSFKIAFQGFSRREFVNKVANGNLRPSPIGRKWPSLCKMVLTEGWDHNPAKRPTMQRVATLIRGDMNTRCLDDSIKNRTQHMVNRSQHSFQMRAGRSAISSSQHSRRSAASGTVST